MNIAQAQKELQELYGLQEKIYESQIAPIEAKIEAHKKFIKDNCTHHEDFLLVEETYETDEYDRHCPSWDKYIVTCSVCGKQIVVNKTKVYFRRQTFSELMSLPQKELEELQ